MQFLFLLVIVASAGYLYAPRTQAIGMKSFCASFRFQTKAPIEINSDSRNESQFVDRNRAQHVSIGIFLEGQLLGHAELEKNKEKWEKENCIIGLGEDERAELQAGYYALEIDACEEPAEKNFVDPYSIRLTFKGKRGGSGLLICRSPHPFTRQKIQSLLGKQFLVSD